MGYKCIYFGTGHCYMLCVMLCVMVVIIYLFANIYIILIGNYYVSVLSAFEDDDDKKLCSKIPSPSFSMSPANTAFS